jgi:hypothetical protein
MAHWPPLYEVHAPRLDGKGDEHPNLDLND